MKYKGLLIFLIFFLNAAVQAAGLQVAAGEGPASLDPFDQAWAKTPSLVLPLMAQIIAAPTGGGNTKSVKLKAIKTGQDIYFRLEWEDEKVNDTPWVLGQYSDAAALMFPAEPVGEAQPSPFMGDKDHPVVIWRWSATAQRDMEQGWGGKEGYADYYPFDQDKTFHSGEGAGNILSQKDRKTAVDNMIAYGFGTITPAQEQPVTGSGLWKKNKWQVVFKRSLAGTPSFIENATKIFNVAVWNGGQNERNGMKSVTLSWHDLDFAGSAEK